MITKPSKQQFAEYQLHYASQVQGDPIQLLHDQQKQLYGMVSALTTEQLDYAYEVGKWTFRQSLIHLLDAERIFAYRALSISRGDQQTLSGFDQDEYIAKNNFDHVTKEQLLSQIIVVRTSTIGLYDIMNQEQLERVGTVSDYQNSAASILYVIVGHCEHHLKLFRQKYL